MWDYRYWRSDKVSSGMQCVDQNNDALKILDTHFPCNKKLKEDKKLNKHLTSTEIMEMRKLTLEGKIVIFKALAIYKIVFQSLITAIPRHIVNELEKMQKFFPYKNVSPKINHETLCNYYKVGI